VMRKSTARKIKQAKLDAQAAQAAARADFDHRWGIGYCENETAEKNDGILVVLLDAESDWRDSDGRLNGNTSVASDVAVRWLFNQPEQSIPGVAEFFKELNTRHRTGMNGGIGSAQHEFTKAALTRVYSRLSSVEIDVAQAATVRLADRLKATFPKARIYEEDQAATPEEIIDFHAEQRGFGSGMVQ